MSKSFLLLVTGLNSNDSAIKRLVGDKPYMCYKLLYTPPYQEFMGIKQFQLEARYRPFEDSTQAEKYAAVDLSDWIGHETEEYLELFMMFIHDYDTSYFNFKYIFVSSCTDQNHIRKLFQLASRYLPAGEMLLDKTFMDEKVLASYMVKKYDIASNISDKLALCFLKGGMKGYAELELVMQDILCRAECQRITSIQEIVKIANTKGSKLYSLYQDSKYLMEEDKKER